MWWLEWGDRSSIQLIAEKGKEGFYEKLGFHYIPHEFCGSAMRKVIRKQIIEGGGSVLMQLAMSRFLVDNR